MSSARAPRGSSGAVRRPTRSNVITPDSSSGISPQFRRAHNAAIKQKANKHAIPSNESRLADDENSSFDPVRMKVRRDEKVRPIISIKSPNRPDLLPRQSCKYGAKSEQNGKMNQTSKAVVKQIVYELLGARPQTSSTTAPSNRTFGSLVKPKTSAIKTYRRTSATSRINSPSDKTSNDKQCAKRTSTAIQLKPTNKSTLTVANRKITNSSRKVIPVSASNIRRYTELHRKQFLASRAIKQPIISKNAIQGSILKKPLFKN